MGATPVAPISRAASEWEVIPVSPTGEVDVEYDFEEAIAWFYGEWVLSKIMAFDQWHGPARILVLAHGPSREAMSDRLALEPPRQPDAPYQPYYTFKAYPYKRPDETMDEARARFRAQREAVEEIRRSIRAG
jgi:hypothetical protein